MTTKQGSRASTKRVNCPDISEARHDALAVLDAAYPVLPRLPGDITIAEYAAARHISHEIARYRLAVMTREGKLQRVQGVTDADGRIVTVYRRTQQ